MDKEPITICDLTHTPTGSYATNFAPYPIGCIKSNVLHFSKYKNKLEVEIFKDAKKFGDILYEDSPTTAMGGGNLAVRGIPLLKKPPKGLVMKRFGGIDVFAIDPTYFQKSRLGKKKYTRYSGYVGEDEAGEYIRAFARKYPKKPIIVMDSSTGCMQYLRHGSEK